MKKNIKALIIDDEKDICFLLMRILQQKNVSAYSAYSLKEARSFLSTEATQLVFIDNHLSDGYGIDFIRDIKSLLPTAILVMITAHDTQIDRDKAFNEGVDYFIGKPFTREIIFQILETALGK